MTGETISKYYPTLRSIDAAFQSDASLTYYILNYQALSLVHFPAKDKKMYKEASEGIRPTPSTSTLDYRLYDIIGMLEKTLITDAFIRSIVGQFFSGFYNGEVSLGEISSAQGIPIIIQNVFVPFTFFPFEFKSFILVFVSKSTPFSCAMIETLI